MLVACGRLRFDPLGGVAFDDAAPLRDIALFDTPNACLNAINPHSTPTAVCFAN